MGEAGLAQAGRPVKEDMVDGFAPAFSGGDGNLEVFLGLVLPDKVGQGARPEAVIQGCVFFDGFAGNNASYCLTPLRNIKYRHCEPSRYNREARQSHRYIQQDDRDCHAATLLAMTDPIFI